MTTYTYTGAVAYDRLGSSWRTAAGLRSVTVTDPTTGLLPANLVQGGLAVSWLTADANSRYSFTCDAPGVVVDFGAGAEALYANEVPGMAIAAGGVTSAQVDARMKWAPSTAYTLGQQILSPNSDVFKANVAHTSAAAYATDVAKWDLSVTFGTTAAVAAKVAKGELTLNVKDYGAVGNGTTDDTTAIQAAINAASAGDVIYFPRTGSGAWYKTTAKLTVVTPNLTFRGNPRDLYAVSIRCAVASVTMIEVKTTGFVLQDLGLCGDSAATNGVGATTTGLDLFGDVDGNIDAAVRGASFMGHAVGVRTRGRNAEISSNTVFTSCLNGVTIDGKDAVYHTGPNADQNRGNSIMDCRFHNIGNAATDAAIAITTTAKVLHARIENNHFDSNGLGMHISAVGTTTNPHKDLTIRGNKHTELGADGVSLTYCNYAAISDALVQGYTGGTYGNGFVFNNCDTVQMSDVLAVQLGKSGVYARNCTRLFVRDATLVSGGIDPGTTGHGLDVDSTNAGCSFDRVKVITGDGWGFIGEPTSSTMTDCDFVSCTLGRISSSTLTNRVATGLNNYTEGKFGRIEDSGRQSYDFTAATAKAVATIAGGGNFSSFLVTVEFTSRDGGGDCYATNTYSVRSENGTPVVTLIGTAAVARVAVTTAAAGTTGVTISLNCTATCSGNVVVRARAGGAANTTNSRGVIVTMA